MYAAAGNCHVFVRRERDFGRGAIAINAKGAAPVGLQAAETLLVHPTTACGLPAARAARAARPAWSCAWTAGHGAVGDLADSLATRREDWETEYHAADPGGKVVDSWTRRSTHVNRYGSGHSRRS